MCSWPELIPAIETGNRSTMFCITCRYKVSIHTQVLQGRVSSKSVDPYLTKPTPGRVCGTRIKKRSREQILFDKEILADKEDVQEDVQSNSPNGWRKIIKKLLDRALRTTRLLSCWRLRRPRTTRRSRLTRSPAVVPSSQRTTCSSWFRGSPNLLRVLPTRGGAQGGHLDRGCITSSTCKRWNSRPKLQRRISLTKTWTAGINCKINHLLCNVFIFNV